MDLLSWYTYNNDDQPLTITDPSNKVTTNTYDDLRRLETVTDPNGVVTTYHYNTEGQVSSVITSGKETKYTYDAFGNRLTLEDPNHNITTWTYDRYGRMTSETDQLGNRKDFKYDSAGRLYEIDKPDGSHIEYTFDELGQKDLEKWFNGASVTKTIDYDYDAGGKLVGVSDNSIILGWTYRKALLTKETQNLGAGILTEFDNVYETERISTATVKVNSQTDSTLNYQWTPAGELDQVTQSGAGVSTKRAKYSYDAGGRKTQIERWSSSEGTLDSVFVTSFSYQNATGGNSDRLKSITHQIPGSGSPTILSSYDYIWDNGGRLTSVTSPADQTTNYSYDGNNQITGVDYQKPSYADLSYSYDANGNRNTNGNVPGPDNRQASDSQSNFTYDANGNLTRRTDKTTSAVTDYSYDIRDRLTDVWFKTSANGSLTKHVHYEYDPLDRRIAERIDNNGDGTYDNEVYFVNQGFRSDRSNAGDDVLLRLNKDGVVIGRYLHGAGTDEVLAEENVTPGAPLGTNEVLWTLTDMQSSVRDLAKVNASNQAVVVDHIMYDAFGINIAESATTVTHIYGYTGREFDKESNLQYNRARYYDPKLGRWLQQDPMGFEAGDANLYRYGGNHGSYASDPSGFVQSGIGENQIDISSPLSFLSSIGGSIVTTAKSMFTRTHSDEELPAVNTFGIPQDKPKKRWAQELPIQGPLLIPIRNQVDALEDDHNAVSHNVHEHMRHDMTFDERERLILLFTIANLIGARKVSDSLSTHDAVDAHRQSTGERIFKGVTGGLELALNTSIVLAPAKSIGSRSASSLIWREASMDGQLVRAIQFETVADEAVVRIIEKDSSFVIKINESLDLQDARMMYDSDLHKIYATRGDFMDFEQLKLVVSHPDSHAIERHGGAITNSQLETRARTGVAPDFSVKMSNGSPVLPPYSTAFHSNYHLLYADKVIREGELARKIAADPTKTFFKVEGEPIGIGLGRGVRRFGAASPDPNAVGPLRWTFDIDKATGIYVKDPSTGVWHTITIYPEPR